MTTNEQLKAARIALVRTSTVFTTTIQNLEKDLERMRSKNLPQEILDARDNDIQTLVEYYNQVDDLIRFYQLQNTNLTIQLIEAINLLIKSSALEGKNSHFLLDYIKSHRHGENSSTENVR